MKVNTVNNMCDRTIKMKLKKGSVLQDVNSNTNTIELNVKPINNFNSKAFGRHAETGSMGKKDNDK